MSILIVIVNYKVSDLTMDCLRSLETEMPALPPRSHVVVVDNFSEDGSADALSSAIDTHGWGSWAEFLPSDENNGFAAGNNIGIEQGLQFYRDSPPDHVLLLNPDTVVRRGGVRVLLDFMEAHPEIGITGSRLEDPDGTPQHSRFRFPSPTNEFEGFVDLGPLTRLLAGQTKAPPIVDEPHEIGWVAGASLMVRYSVIEEIGLLDDDYFLYFEETDFCLRARRAGWSCWYVPDSHVVHLVGKSSGVTIRERRPARRPAYWFDSRRRYFLKNYGVVYTMAVDVASVIGLILGRLGKLLRMRPNMDPPHFLRDLCANTVFFRGGRLKRTPKKKGSSRIPENSRSR